MEYRHNVEQFAVKLGRTFAKRAALGLAAAIVLGALSLALVRTFTGSGAGPPNDSSIFGIPPSEIAQLPANKQTSVAGNLATRAVLLQTPVPTPAHSNPNNVLRWPGPPRPPLGAAQILAGLSPGDAGSASWYVKRNGWEGAIGGVNVDVYAGGLKAEGSADASATSLVIVRRQSTDGTLLSHQQFSPPSNIGPLTVTSFDSNDVLTMHSDDGSATVYFDAATGRFIASAAAAPSAPTDPTRTPTPLFGQPRIRVAEARAFDGLVQIPIVAEGAGFADYTGFSIHLQWDPSVFRFEAADNIWGEFQDATCIPPAVDPDGAGVIFSCNGRRELTASDLPTFGLLATVLLRPAGPGCSLMHLVPLHFGGAATGASYTVASITGAPQSDQYLDASIDPGGHPCQSPPPSSTASTP
jgi:hypothetical protein